MIELTIDGKKVKADEGSTILDAAKALGIEIPTLCYYEMLEPYGACRLCVVEITEGKKTKLVTSCNYPVSAGLEVNTFTDRVVRARKMVIELLLARCPEAEVLQELAKQYGIEKPRFKPHKEERDDCILCGLCVRMCDDLVKAHAICFEDRGIKRQVTTPFNEPTDKCLTCGACAYVCPTGVFKVEDEKGRKIQLDELVLGPKTPVYVPTRQAVPNVPVIDKESCIHFQTEGCGICEKVCEPEAINYKQEEEIIEAEVGNIIIATGFRTFNPERLPQYGYKKLPNVITGLDFEKLNAASGPTGGNILMENGEPPKSVGIVHCFGSRDVNTNAYCSRVCCMYALKFAHLIKEKIDAVVYNFYIDMRCFGKGYEEFYNRLLEEDVRFIRGKVAALSDFAITDSEKGKIVVRVEDTLAGYVRRIPLDMAVLCTGLETADDSRRISRFFGCGQDKSGWFIEKHPKLAPVSTATDGVFIAGACQGPKDIPDAVAQGSAAAANVLSLISRKQVEVEAATCEVNPDICAGCRICNTMCPVNAMDFDEKEMKSVINDALCKGCGTCAAACPNAAIKAKHFTDKQIFAEIEGILAQHKQVDKKEEVEEKKKVKVPPHVKEKKQATARVENPKNK